MSVTKETQEKSGICRAFLCRSRSNAGLSTTPPCNPHHPVNPSDTDSLLRPNTGPGDPGPDLHTSTDGGADADGNSGTHGGPDRETHGRAQGDAGQFSDPRTDSNARR